MTRLGVTATRRLGGATVRNRARRRVREIFRRQVRHALAGAGPVDLVVNLQDGAAAASFADVAAEFLRLARRATGGGA